MIHGASDYALTRLQARMAREMRGNDWRRLGNARGTVAVLALLRASAAARWANGLSGSEDPHRIESQAELRERFRERVREIARWADPGWRAALDWCAQWVDLNPADGETDPAAAWLTELQRLVPPLAGSDRDELNWLVRTLSDHRQGVCRTCGRHWLAPARGSAAPAGDRIGRYRLCVAHLLTAVALLWLEYERVRGELLRWAALPGAAT